MARSDGMVAVYSVGSDGEDDGGQLVGEDGYSAPDVGVRIAE